MHRKLLRPIHTYTQHGARHTYTEQGARGTEHGARMKIESLANFNFPIENNIFDHASVRGIMN